MGICFPFLHYPIILVLCALHWSLVVNPRSLHMSAENLNDTWFELAVVLNNSDWALARANKRWNILSTMRHVSHPIPEHEPHSVYKSATVVQQYATC